MKIIHEFRIWCTTDNKYITTYGLIPPTKCTEDTSHDIDINKTVIEDTSNPNETTIKEFDSTLGGFYKVKGEYMNIPEEHIFAGKTTNTIGVSDMVIEVDDAAINVLTLDHTILLKKEDNNTILGKVQVIDRHNKQITVSGKGSKIALDTGADILIITTIKDFIQPIDIGVLSFSYNSTIKHEGDSLEVHVYPNLLIGAITNFIKVGDNLFNVSPTVVANIKRGFYCRLDDGVTTECMGIVTNVDVVNNQISVSKSSKSAFSPLGPTLVKMTVKMLDINDIGPPFSFQGGQDKIGGSNIKKNTPVRVCYANKINGKKRFCFNVGHIY